jgi:hypothetical protein
VGVLLKWTLKEYGRRVWTELICFRAQVGSCEHDNELPGSRRGEEFLE